jgi:uncharacterized membrane protein
MNKNRLEAFSDGVIAIIITIMVLELKVPHSTDLHALRELIPVFLGYVLSFVYVAIYWHNHHHMFHTVKHINGGIMWANTHLLFWLSLIPFTTAYMTENHFAKIPVLLYGWVLLLAALAYFITQWSIIKSQWHDSLLKKAVQKDIKGKLSPLFYILALIGGIWTPVIAISFHVLVALMWLIPDKRIERIIQGE